MSRGKRAAVIVLTPLALLVGVVLLPLSRVNAETDSILTDAKSVTVELGSYGGNQEFAGKVERYKITITDPALIDELRQASATKGESLVLGMHCACSGYPIIRTADGRFISYHHERSLRVPHNSTNYDLIDPLRFARWLNKAGLPLDHEMRKLAYGDLFDVPKP